MVIPISLKDISVILPVKDGAEFIEKTISKLQTVMTEGEVIIIDDGSADTTFEIVTAQIQHFENFKLLRNSGDGLCAALNYGIRNSTGSWISRLDADDDFDINKFTQQLALLNRTNAIAVFADYGFYGDGSKYLGYMPSGLTNVPMKLSLISGRRSAHPTAIFSKIAFHSVGGYLEEDFPAEDLSLWLRLMKLGDFASVGEELLMYRLSGSSVTVKNITASRQKKEDLLRKYPIDAEIQTKSIETLSDTLFIYRGSRDANKRIVLHLLDLLNYSKKYQFPMPLEKKVKIFLMFLFPQYFGAILKLVIEGALRRLYRMKLQ